MYVKVVTNPELGWDCVCTVYSDKVKDKDIKEVFGSDVIIEKYKVETEVID